uniref:Uncharacterized protein n=1 Tax=Setaria viridis TaxID=4556 RepID=A0A4U6TI36_SETVI|nr:hypothetical protein SEVIR_8G119701v2 [Setaria viridis]
MKCMIWDYVVLLCYSRLNAVDLTPSLFYSPKDVPIIIPQTDRITTPFSDLVQYWTFCTN